MNQNDQMQYHCWVILADGKNYVKINGHVDWFKSHLIVPIFNGQTIVLDSYKRDFIINTGSISRLYIFATAYELNDPEDELIKKFESEEFIGNNCTREIIEQVRKEQSSQKTKSLLEKSFSELEDQIFVIMTFGSEVLDSAYEGVIEPVVNEFGLSAVRVDKIQDSGKINDQILENIAKSRFVISELSEERPNCYYETGFAHALGKELILIVRDGEKIHFDLAGYRFISWKTEAELRRKLRKRLTALIEA